MAPGLSKSILPHVKKMSIYTVLGLNLGANTIQFLLLLSMSRKYKKPHFSDCISRLIVRPEERGGKGYETAKPGIFEGARMFQVGTNGIRYLLYI